METKTCNVCNESKPLSEFYFVKSRNRHMNYCGRCHLDKLKEYRQNSPEYQEYHKDYQQTKKYKKMLSTYKRSEHGKEKHRLQQQKYRDTLKMDVLGHYSGQTMKCARCPYSDVRALTIDHMNGDGANHRKQLKNPSKMYQWLRSNGYPDGFQVLCMNCQFIKKQENKENRKKLVRLLSETEMRQLTKKKLTMYKMSLQAAIDETPTDDLLANEKVVELVLKGLCPKQTRL